MTTAREIASRFWLDTFSKADLERAISAAIADEREACALLAERIGVEQYELFSERDPELVGDDIAKAIRNRSN